MTSRMNPVEVVGDGFQSPRNAQSFPVADRTCERRRRPLTSAIISAPGCRLLITATASAQHIYSVGRKRDDLKTDQYLRSKMEARTQNSRH